MSEQRAPLQSERRRRDYAVKVEPRVVVVDYTASWIPLLIEGRGSLGGWEVWPRGSYQR
jgi:hypothetical protein